METEQNQNQSLKKQLKNLTSKAKTAEDITLLIEKVQNTNKINRRTKDGKKLQGELLDIIYERANYLADYKPNEYYDSTI